MESVNVDGNRFWCKLYLFLNNKVFSSADVPTEMGTSSDW
jgi:hypothetical protein